MMYKDNEPYILVFGASVVDIFGVCNINLKYKSHDSNPGKIRIEFGGVSRNIAENMARIGLNIKFISIVGDDEQGQAMIEHSKIVGYDMSNSLVLENGRTPSYLAILDEAGEMVSAVADLENIKAMNKEFIESKRALIEEAEYTFLDADDPINLEYILENFQGKTKFILDPISTEKAKSIKHLVHYFHTIKPNKHEAEALSGIKIETKEDLKKVGRYFKGLGVKNVFISLDAEGIYYYNGEEEGHIKSGKVEVKNVTGAGDSFVAGLGYGYTNNLTLEETVKFAMTMSIIAISYEGTINPELDIEKVKTQMAQITWENK